MQSSQLLQHMVHPISSYRYACGLLLFHFYISTGIRSPREMRPQRDALPQREKGTHAERGTLIFFHPALGNARNATQNAHYTLLASDAVLAT